jgi:hypothetical protein
MCGEKCKLRIVISICLLLNASISTFAAEAKGFIRAESCSFLESNRLHLVEIDKRKLSKSIVLRFPGQGIWENLLNSWQEVDGADCTGSDHCATVAHAKVKLDRISSSAFIPFHKRRVQEIAGRFAVELDDGSKIEGSFVAKALKPEHPMICE